MIFNYCLDCTDGEIRIVNGSTALQGRVELCVNRNWGTICDAGWGAPEASVVCRQLGFSPTGKHSYITNNNMDHITSCLIKLSMWG